MSPSPPRGMIRSTRRGLGRELGELVAVAARRAWRSRPSGTPAPRRRRRRRSRRARRSSAPRARGPAQDDRVARLQAQRRGVDRDVRPRLVDDGDTPSGTRTLRISRPFGRRKPSITSPTGSGSAAIARTPAAIAAIRRSSSVEPVEQRRRQAGLAAGLDVGARWPRGSRRVARLERGGDRLERGVLDRRCRASRARARRAGAARADLRRPMPWRSPSRRRRLREDEVVAVDGLVARPAAASSRTSADCQPRGAPQIGRRVVADPLADQPAGVRRPRRRRPRRTRRAPRRRRPAAGSCPLRAARAPRRRRRRSCPGSASRTAATA